MANDTLPLFETAFKFYVYVYYDTRPNKNMVPIYVGKGTAANGRAYIHWKNKSSNILLNNILQKMRDIGVEPRIDIVGWFNDDDDAKKLEIDLIRKFGRRDKGVGPLCNLTDGGDGVCGRRQSDDGRRRISEAMKKRRAGTKLSEEHKRNISKGLMGREVSPETRKRIADAQRGKIIPQWQRDAIRKKLTGTKHSEEQKRKISRSLGKAKHKFAWEIDGKLFYKSTDAAEYYGICIAAVYWRASNGRGRKIPLTDPEVQKRVASGELRELSIGGTGKRKKI